MGLSEASRGEQGDERSSHTKAWKRFSVRVSPFATIVSALAFLLVVKILISSLYLQFDSAEVPVANIALAANEGVAVAKEVDQRVDFDELERTLRKRELALIEREDALKKREDALIPLQQEVNAKFDELNALQSQLTAYGKKLVDKEQIKSEAKIEHLVSLYSSMEPRQAAAIMDRLNLDTVLFIMSNMKGKDAGEILALIKPEKGATISEQLSKLK
ncbi:MAG: hypothetical protein JRI86_09855 [Deltaproteobacteria bacterium]|nr:hypothetical protein [Deltaproteobacteria bacterium]